MTKQTHREIIAKLAKAHDAKSKDANPGIANEANDLVRQVASIAMKIVSLKSKAKDDEKALSALRSAEAGLDSAVTHLTNVSRMK